MPKRPDMAVMPRRGKDDETLYSPSAALKFIKEVLGYSLGESTMRLWRRNGKGPPWYRDSAGKLWYKEGSLKKFYAGKEADLDPLTVAEQKAHVLEVDHLQRSAPAPMPGTKPPAETGFLSRPKLNIRRPQNGPIALKGKTPPRLQVSA